MDRGAKGRNPLRLSSSDCGTPAVTWHSPERAAHYRAEFARWRSSGEVNERFFALGAWGCGVFVFYEGG